MDEYEEIEIELVDGKLDEFPEIYYSARNDTIKRSDGCGKRYDVIDIVEGIFKDYDPQEWSFSHEQEKHCYCVCSKKIYKPQYIKHSSGTLMRIGSDCIKKFNENLYNVITKGQCAECGSGLTDRRNKYQKMGYCNPYCKNIKYMNKCETILNWARTRPKFDTTFIDKLYSYGSRNQLTNNQKASIDKIIMSWRIM
jgi:hypothetical protein